MNSYKIYPAIGVARVGDARQKFYIGPEAYRGLPINPDGAPFTERDFRDAEGRMCRQAARFKIYRDTPQGQEEVTLSTPGVKAIEWTVHVANKKAAWYAFQTNSGEYGYASNHPVRNAWQPDRQQLVIDAGPRSIHGRAQRGPQARHFDAASVPPGYRGAHFPPLLYPGKIAIETLGELQTDDVGRLLFLGGLGKAGSTEPNASIQQYANNDHWWDDTSDGPVTAMVTLNDGSRIDAGTAWVLVAPPAYAPEIPNLVTLWDTVFDTAVRSGHHPDIYAQGFWRSGAQGYRPSYRGEIAPLLERATLYPWVAAIPPKPHRFDMARLGQVPQSVPTDEYRGLRQWILGVLRPPGGENEIIGDSGRTMMPYLAGDNALNLDTLTSKYLRLTDTQYFFLQQWAEGWFRDDALPANPAEALTRAVLENCVGGAFSPGIEMTWIARNPAIYQPKDPVRVNADLVLHGPLSQDFTPARMQPGDVSRYMAVPWQADFNECASQPLDGRVLWWWPAQRPEFVYLDPSVRQRALALKAEPVPDVDSGMQVAWIGTDFDQLRPDFITFPDDVQMVRYWSGLGFVMKKFIPSVNGERYVEVARSLPRPFFPGADEPAP
jgi:hypothetical protein